MKGYVVTALIAMALLLCMPPIFAQRSSTEQTSVTATNTTFQVQHADGETKSTVDGMKLTLYATAGCLSAEAPDEAIKACAAAWYTLFCYQQAQKDTAGVVTAAVNYPEAFTESYWQERWGENYPESMARFQECVTAVYGRQLLHDGQAIMAVTHGMNSGKTEAWSTLWEQDILYLQAVDSPWDAAHAQQLSTVTVSVADAEPILKTLTGIDTLPEATTWFGESVTSDAGTVKELAVCGKTVSGMAMMDAFSLPSAAFAVCVQEEEVIFTVRGNGHFTGMSLCGAVAMAEEGKDWQAIVKHYYTGITIE